MFFFFKGTLLNKIKLVLPISYYLYFNLKLLNAMKIRVLIADDHKLFAQSLLVTLNNNEKIEVVTICHNSKDTLWDLQLHKPDILLLDLNMPTTGKDILRATGFDVLEQLKTTSNNPTKAIVLSNYTDYGLIKQSLKLGAMGYLLKNTSIEELELAICEVFAGKTYLPKNVLENIELEKTQQDEDSFVGACLLTKREREVLKLLSKGFTNENIAKALGIKKFTVMEYRENMMNKLKAVNAPDLVRIAYEQHLL
jgi:DNA-binding NarL/FixJ family response regulator